jgi:hypothetical protein
MQLMLSQSSLGLLLDPGMGKTSTWLGAFCTLKALGLVDRMLVIAPLLPMYDTWPREIDKYNEFNHLTWCFLHGPDKDYHLRNTEADIYLINPEGIQWLVEKADPSKLADVLCVDESTKFKNSQSKRFKALRTFFPRFDRRWIGTGTPSPNGLEDLFGQIFILDGGHSLGKYITHFRNKWFYTEHWNPYKWIPHAQSFEEITTAIAPLVLQLSAEDYLEMPTLKTVDKLVTLPSPVKQMYKELVDDYMANSPDGEEEFIAPTEAAVSIKCRQICNGALFLNENVRSGQHDYKILHDTKLDMMDELLEEIGEHPTLIVYEFQHDLHRIAKRHLDWPCLTGMAGSCLQNMLKEFDAGNVPRLLIQSSQAHGLNIQASCHHMIFFGLTWNWEHYKQMVDRLYRQGQSSNIVMLYRILAEATIEMQVATRLKEKMEEEYNVKKAVSEKREQL